MEIEENFFDKLKNEKRCVKIRNSIDYCTEISNNADDMEAVERLRRLIEPWLSGILQSEYLSMLIGTGLTQSV